MLRNAIFAAAVIALTPALAIAAPTATKTTHPAITQPVKAEKAALVKHHHHTKLGHKVRMERHLKAKTETTKS